jgi:hypothetical protein
MIQVIVRIVPAGDKTRAFEHAIAEVTRERGHTVCDYAMIAGEDRNPVTCTRDWSSRGHLLQHDRRQSVWALVAKVAAWAASEADKAAAR